MRSPANGMNRCKLCREVTPVDPIGHLVHWFRRHPLGIITWNWNNGGKPAVVVLVLAVAMMVFSIVRGVGS